jgi:hypothetical protein
MEWLFFTLGQKNIANSTFYDTYLFHINFFYSRCSYYFLHGPKILIEKKPKGEKLFLTVNMTLKLLKIIYKFSAFFN